MRTLLSLLCCALLAACDDGKPDDSADDSATPAACGDRAPDACETDDACVAITGRTLATDDLGACIDWTADAAAYGCMGADLGCGQAITFAASPDAPEDCKVFNNTCIPDGWETCEIDYRECEER